MNIQVEHLIGSYYIAELDEPTHVPGGDMYYSKDFPDTDHWCTETFGSQDMWGETPVSGWKRMRNKYYFITKSACELFVLRWS